MTGSLACSREQADVQCGPAADPGGRFAEDAQGTRSTARLCADLCTEVDQLREALTSRATIDQAKGVIMAAYRCGPDDAFRILVRLSQTRNLKVRELASQVVARVSNGDIATRCDTVPGVKPSRSPSPV